MTDYLCRIVGRVSGTSVAAIVAIPTLAWLAGLSIHWGLKVFFGVLTALPIIGVSWRMIKGTEQGSTDVEVSRDGLRLLNIPQASFTSTIQAGLMAFAVKQYGHLLLHGLPPPTGRVTGSPARESNLVEDSMASLPEEVRVTEGHQEPPSDAVRLSFGSLPPVQP